MHGFYNIVNFASQITHSRRKNIPEVALRIKTNSRFSLQEMKPLTFLESQKKMKSKHKIGIFWFPQINFKFLNKD